MTVTIDQLAKVLYELEFSFKLDRENELAFVFPNANAENGKPRMPKVIVRYVESLNLIRVRTTQDYRIGEEEEIKYLKLNDKVFYVGLITVKYEEDNSNSLQVVNDVPLKNGAIDVEKLGRVVVNWI